MEIGQNIKVFLPGESPWAEVLEINGPLVKARIANKLFHEYSLEQQRQWTGENFDTAEPLKKLHNFKQDDEVWFEQRDYGDFKCWEPVVRQ